MPRRDPDLLVSDILAAILRIQRHVGEMDRESFLQDEKTIDAVVRNLEVIGEASGQLPDDFTGRYPKVPWRQISGLLNRIVHEYFGVDLEIIWQVLHDDLPALRDQMEKLA